MLLGKKTNTGRGFVGLSTKKHPTKKTWKCSELLGADGNEIITIIWSSPKRINLFQKMNAFSYLFHYFFHYGKSQWRYFLQSGHMHHFFQAEPVQSLIFCHCVQFQFVFAIDWDEHDVFCKTNPCILISSAELIWNHCSYIMAWVYTFHSIHMEVEDDT